MTKNNFIIKKYSKAYVWSDKFDRNINNIPWKDV